MFRALSVCSLFFIFLAFPIKSWAQPGWTLDPFGQEKKPEQFQERKLGSEKTAEKKFTFLRHLTQNTVTHYNYYFNANNKLKMIMEQARAAHKDDFTKLLSFYPYSLDNTASQQVELDSIIYKATAGILLHDLRNDWIDDMYMLIGKAYFFRKQFDTAEMTFQFINYNMFPRKKGEDDNRVVGSNLNAPEPGSMFSIADKENTNVLKKAFSQPPCRNDALVWLGRTFTEATLYSDAAGMINILQQDPNLPSRLRGDLDELNAYWFYKQEMYDSCAPYLEKALDNAPTKQDRSRWEFLLGQLYQRTGNYSKASRFYLDAAHHTIDPMIDIYANLSDARMQAGNGDNSQLQNNISRLLRMGRQDKYNAYRDIIYYAAGDLTLRKPDTTAATELFLKSLKYNEGNESYRNKSFLKLADIFYDKREYKQAAAYYDSVDIADTSFSEADTAYIAARKKVLSRVAELITIIEREDSLQALAKLSPAALDAAVKKMVKTQKKAAGGKQEDDTGANIGFANQKDQPPPDLFASSSKGEWYFYNASVRTKGYNEFVNKWGKRANLDNWRRKNSVDAAMKNISANIDIDAPASADSSNAKESAGPVPGSYDALMADIPLSPEKIDSSNKRLSDAYIELALIFQNELMDYEEAIYEYDQFMMRFDPHPRKPEALAGLYFCYTKLGMSAEADKYKRMLTQGYAGSEYAKKVNDPKSMLPPGSSDSKETTRYEQIYNLFIEGKFNEALAAKQLANEEQGTGYWTPQLLYLEAVYYVREKNDSAAIRVLDDIIRLFPQSPMRAKAETMKDVVSRRKEIEAYLTNLDVTRAPDEKVMVPESRPAAIPAAKPAQPKKEDAPPPPIKPSLPTGLPQIARDTIKQIPSMVNAGYVLKPDNPHFVLMVLDKVDAVYINEVKNAFARINRERSETRGLVINREALTPEKNLLTFESFEDANAAMAYMERLKKSAPSSISWLPAAKYSFLIITEDNLKYMRESKDISAYRTLLSNQYPGKF